MTDVDATIDPLSRGDTMIRKINTWPQAIVAVTGIAAVAGIVVSLVLAGWSSEAIVGFGTLALALVTGQYVQTRRASVVEAKTDEQTHMLRRVVSQTNGMSEEEKQDIAERAAASVVRQFRGDI